MKRTHLCIILAVSLCLGSSPAIGAHDQWFVSLYGGRYSDRALLETLALHRTRLESSSVYVLSLGKGMGSYRRDIDMEWEAQLGKHAGAEQQYEVNGAFTLRLEHAIRTPHLDGSLAFGNGLSYAFDTPALEVRDSSDHASARLLYYILVELAFAPPRPHHWEYFFRIHHRSSVYRLFDGIMTGSNYLGLGIRYRY